MVPNSSVSAHVSGHVFAKTAKIIGQLSIIVVHFIIYYTYFNRYCLLVAGVRGQFSHGGMREGARRPGAGVFIVKVKVDAEIRDKWNELKAKGSFNTNASFLSHLLKLEEDRTSSDR